MWALHCRLTSLEGGTTVNGYDNLFRALLDLCLASIPLASELIVAVIIGRWLGNFLFRTFGL